MVPNKESTSCVAFQWLANQYFEFEIICSIPMTSFSSSRLQPLTAVFCPFPCLPDHSYQGSPDFSITKRVRNLCCFRIANKSPIILSNDFSSLYLSPTSYSRILSDSLPPCLSVDQVPCCKVKMQNKYVHRNTQTEEEKNNYFALFRYDTIYNSTHVT